jgi:hypothetical protein
MAERASAAGVAADMNPPKYREAVKRLRGIVAKKAKIAGVNGEISGIYDTVEGYKVNKKAGRIFLTLDALEADERADILRSLFGLIEVAEWEPGGDMVDQAEGAAAGNIIAAQFGGRREKSRDGENAAGEDLELEETLQEIEQPEPAAEEPAPSKRKRLSPAEARAKVAEHFAQGEAPPPSGQEAPEPYAGDDADLNPDPDPEHVGEIVDEDPLGIGPVDGDEEQDNDPA